MPRPSNRMRSSTSSSFHSCLVVAASIRAVQLNSHRIFPLRTGMRRLNGPVDDGVPCQKKKKNVGLCSASGLRKTLIWTPTDIPSSSMWARRDPTPGSLSRQERPSYLPRPVPLADKVAHSSAPSSSTQHSMGHRQTQDTEP